MWWALVVLACLDAISSQPLTHQVSDALTLVECCPCPGSERSTLDALGSASQPIVNGILVGKTDVDDCPCRVRDTDSDTAPSVFLPRVLRPLRPDVNPEGKNEDAKPLLHPEVDLASSVLETLRDATEEEYQEALARDAARNAARVPEDEPVHQVAEPGNADIVTIIVNPKADEEEDIIISEASHVQESRCPHAFGISRSNLGQVRPTTPLLPTKRLLRLPKFESKSLSRRPIDMHNSASNIEEQVVNANRRLEKFKLKSSPSKLSEFLEQAKSQILESSSNDGPKKYFISPNVPNFRIDSLLRKDERTGFDKNEGKLKVNAVEQHTFPIINISNEKTTILDSVSDLDSSTSPNTHEQLSKTLSQKVEKNNLKSFLEKKRTANLKSLFSLKNVELNQNKPSVTKINKASLKISQDAKNVNEPFFTAPTCEQEKSSENSMKKITLSKEQTNNMQDTDFSPSQNQPTSLETEKKIRQEIISEDDISNETLDTKNRSCEVHKEFDEFGFDKESENLKLEAEERESLERESSSGSTEITNNSDETEGIDSIELPREDNLQNEGDGHDSFLDASNNEFHFIPQDDYNKMEYKEKDVEIETDKNENKLKRIYKDVPSLKEKMLKKLENLKDDIAHIKNGRQTYLKIAESKDKNLIQNALEKDDAATQTVNTNLDLTTQELISSREINQLNENFGSLPKSSEFEVSSQELNISVEPSENIREDSDENKDMNPSASSSETTILDSVSFPFDSEDNPQITGSDIENESTNDNINDQPNSSENSLEKTCMADINKNIEKKAKNINIHKEMSSQASELIPNIIPQPSERQSIVVQPTSLFGDNSLFRPLPGVPNLLNLDAHLPTLDEIRSSLSGILGIGARETDNDDGISAEFQSVEDCSGAMSTGASTTSLKSVFPNRRPLEDINLNIFQLNPKSQKGLLGSRAPGLNLNSYKAKLALPQNLGLKPIRLESSLGKNGNLLGATLTFGPEKIGSSKFKMSRPSSILDRTIVSSLESTLPRLPDLDDVKSTIRARAENLLNSPLSIAPTHTVQKVSELTDNLRSHTENTVKNIQQTLASTLSESRVKEIPFIEKIARPSPKDLLEKLSTAREDMSDKLKALHADLADRLSSIHDNIAERSTLPTLQLPLFSQINRNYNPKFRTRPKGFTKSKDSVTNMRSNKAGSSNLRSSATRKTDEITVKPFKISKAASTLTPKTVEVPKLMRTTSSKLPFAKPLQRDSTVKLKDSRPFESSMTVDKKPISRNNVRPIESKPTLSGRPVSKHEFGSQSSTLIDSFAKDTLRNKANLGSSLRFDDSRGFASEVQPARIPAPVRSSVIATERTEPKQTQATRSKVKPLFSNQNLGVTSLINTPSPATKDPVSTSLIHKPLPKAGDSPLLSKMKESVLGRHLSKTISLNDDMARSLTENNRIEVRKEPLKENVKYRCRMVCVKEPIE